MSLDVYLYKTITCEHCGKDATQRGPCVYSANITHNLGRMAAEAGIYDCLWHPDEHGITRASQLIEPLRNGLVVMRADRARFEAFNAPNGWGLYENFVPWVARYLEACEEHPTATVEVCR